MLIGIDLGTTNSAAAIWQEGAARLIPAGADGALLTPSAVSCDAAGATWVGTPARDRRAAHPADTATSFKRAMGTNTLFHLAGREFRAEDLSALVLRALVEDIAAETGTRPTEAVITVPAYFNDRQRKATRQAGELAGLTVRRLINEPTAAALAFGLQDKGDREPFLVFDLGGGTFDVSIVEMFEGIVEVRASAGDNRLGGDDFDRALIALTAPHLDPEGRLAGLPETRREALLARAAERCRKALSSAAKADFTVTLDGETQLSVTVGQDEFEAACAPLLDRLRDPIVRALRDSDIAAHDLSEIVLVGGATRMPAVRKAITRLFGRFPNAAVHPDHAVALGAAIQAGLAARDAALDEVRITDVCPYTLGVEVAEPSPNGGLQKGLFSPIIERNTPVPVSRVQSYSTLSDGQKQIEFGIYQGEAREVARNIRLGEIRIPVPARPAGEVDVDVRFSYDSSGLLEVDLHIPLDDSRHNLVILDEEDREGPESLAARREALAALKFHPREDAANMALLARAERCYEDHIGPVRQNLGRAITRFTGILDTQEPRLIAEARDRLSAQLDAIEGSSPL
ncbi:Hsp70 family protein [Novosphingobium mangrovi (ex Hu et al. 2023)]|uniref:Hsp70 family protein n=1 Tax=Novosphingobium mangrovi (ex Hu et al. 2023) TaxID=2930094 RepID=A0ABT0AGU3_9SPHN|nr:Hsp70 family protein [Novosphingobium mangrovi (ex Hu et al. 2023)]MCJ1962428.1 Hsp70 family protein [Novosphingobium mangrovi (ex Hu et al. 2023)]